MDPIEIAIAVIMVTSVGGGMVILTTLVRGAVAKWNREAQIEPQAVAELREAIGRLAGEVGELHERMDFAERLLSAARQPGQMKGEQ